MVPVNCIQYTYMFGAIRNYLYDEITYKKKKMSIIIDSFGGVSVGRERITL